MYVCMYQGKIPEKYKRKCKTGGCIVLLSKILRVKNINRKNVTAGNRSRRGCVRKIRRPRSNRGRAFTTLKRSISLYLFILFPFVGGCSSFCSTVFLGLYSTTRNDLSLGLKIKDLFLPSSRFPSYKSFIC